MRATRDCVRAIGARPQTVKVDTIAGRDRPRKGARARREKHAKRGEVSNTRVGPITDTCAAPPMMERLMERMERRLVSTAVTSKGIPKTRKKSRGSSVALFSRFSRWDWGSVFGRAVDDVTAGGEMEEEGVVNLKANTM